MIRTPAASALVYLLDVDSSETSSGVVAETDDDALPPSDSMSSAMVVQE